MKINATYEDTEENMIGFAATQGWTETIVDLDTQEEIANPISLEEFLSTWAQRSLKGLIASPTKRAIKQHALAQAKVAQDELDLAVEENLTVQIE